ncbi:MAG TPA: beta/gamma crystallin-related protein [Macromonas sp.]|nr:beta/gamma crystallin-related protein [Macromonas sp.]
MNALFKSAWATAALLAAMQAGAQVTLYENDGFQGRSVTAEAQIPNLQRFGFNDRISSVVVTSPRWEVCEDNRYRGHCVVLRPGRYPSLVSMGLNNRISSLRTVNNQARIHNDRYAPMPLPPQVTFFEHEGFGGRSFTTEQEVANIRRMGFNDRASSVVVVGAPWEVCENNRFSGRCVVLRPGRYDSLRAMGLSDRVSSVRYINANTQIDDRRYAPVAAPIYDARRRSYEQLYEANVTSARAVLGTPEQRCWVERDQVTQERGDRNVAGALIGGLIGGVLGHQVGGGTGQDLATVGGAVAGAAIGSNVGRDRETTQDVQRCTSVPNQASPDYWDVTYTFRNREHRVQMLTRPGPTVTVNEQGEPRI